MQHDTERNDCVFAIAVFGAMTAVSATYAIWRLASSATAASWVQAFGTIAAILGAAWISNREWRRIQSQKRFAVSAQITVELRLWMEKVYENYGMTELFESSNGHAGEKHCKIPSFSFEKNFHLLGLLPPSESSAILELELMHREIWRSQRFEFETNGWEDDMWEDFCGRLGNLYLAVNSVHGRLAAISGIQLDTRLNGMRDAMARAAKRSSVQSVEDL